MCQRSILPELLICEDPENEKNDISSDHRDKLDNWFLRVLKKRDSSEKFRRLSVFVVR